MVGKRQSKAAEAMPSLDDVRLAHGTSDREAARALLERLTPRVRTFVLRLTGGGAEVDDLVQSSLVAILESAHRYRGDSPLESWADGVTYRVAMRQLKRLRRRERTMVADDLERHGNDDHTSDPHLAARLEKHLHRLTPAKRAALYLRVVLGHSVAEVAKITDVPVNTVRDRLRTALRELRRSIHKDTATLALARKQGGC